MQFGDLFSWMMRRLTFAKAERREDQIVESGAIELSDEDRQLFAVLCQFIWIQGGPIPLIFNIEDTIYSQQGITQVGLERLQTLGLIVFDAQGFVKKGFGKHTRLFYCDRPTKIGFEHDQNNSLDLGHVLLTEKGKQYSAQIKSEKNQLFYEYVIQRWFQQRLILTSIQIDRNR